MFGSEKYDGIYDRIIYPISFKSSITYIFSHYFAKIKIDSYDSLAIEETLTLHNVIEPFSKSATFRFDKSAKNVKNNGPKTEKSLFAKKDLLKKVC